MKNSEVLDDEIEIPEELQPDANEIALERLLSEDAALDEIVYKVHRRLSDTDPRDLEFVMAAPASDFPTPESLQLHLAQNYGGGKYRLYVFVRGKLKKNMEIKIAESKLKPALQSAGFDAAGVKITQVLERMIATSTAQHQREMEALRSDLKELRAQPAVDPLAQIEKLAGLLRTLMPAQPTVAPVQSNGFGDMLRFMDLQEKLEERFRERNRDPDAPFSWGDILQSAPKIIESLKGIRIEGRNGAGALPVEGRNGAGALPVEGQNGAGALPASDKLTLALPPGVAAAPLPLPENSGVNMSDDFSRLLPLFQVLNGQAVANNDPATYAALIEDNADSVAGPGTLQKLLSYPDLQTRIETVYPQAKPYHEWWSELIALLREEPESDANSSAGTAGEHTDE